MAIFTAIAMGVMAVGTAIMARRQSVQGMEDQAKKYGIHSAQTKFSAERDSYSILQRISSLQTQALQESILIDAAQARAESDAKVQAAAAGVDGQSVEAVINDTERSQQNAQASLDEKVRAEHLQFATDLVDNSLNADLATGRLDTRTKSRGQIVSEYALSFGKGFVSGGGFGGTS